VLLRFGGFALSGGIWSGSVLTSFMLSQNENEMWTAATGPSFSWNHNIRERKKKEGRGVQHVVVLPDQGLVELQKFLQNGSVARFVVI
jgi:hypothetical protein